MVQARGEISLDGSVALITGGGRGIGRSIALALSAAGAAVTICARSEDQLTETVRQIEAGGGRALMAVVDVRNRAAVAHAVERTVRELGPIDVLVNNAGTASAGPFAQTDPDRWWETLEVNLRGPVYCSQAVLPAMIARGRGCIVNIISGAAFNPIPMMSDYCVSKAALQRFTENLAIEVSEQDIAVFAIDPGIVRTEMFENMLSSGIPFTEQMFQGFLAQGLDVPAGRTAQLVTFLASGQADALSGRYLDANEDIWTVLQRTEEIRASDLYVLRARR